jgi:hypothetical protein
VGVQLLGDGRDVATDLIELDDAQCLIGSVVLQQGLQTALSTWLGLSGIGVCRGSVGWVSVVWVRLRQSVR